jgi:2-amino-4-hydroxy-6-hydroxymethyldihydropteridine diphosphokinase
VAIYLGLGSNLGNRQANLALALRMLEPLVRVEAVSALYESPPQPPAPPPPYYNAACRVVTGLAPQSLLRHLKRIETLIGRHDAARLAPRPIDLDILIYDAEVIDSEALVLPHPRLTERAFVLRPLLDLNAKLTHPVTGERVDLILRRVGEDGLVRLAEPGWQLEDSVPLQQ